MVKQKSEFSESRFPGNKSFRVKLKSELELDGSSDQRLLRKGAPFKLRERIPSIVSELVRNGWVRQLDELVCRVVPGSWLPAMYVVGIYFVVLGDLSGMVKQPRRRFGMIRALLGKNN
jgi:hypothetical protein